MGVVYHANYLTWFEIGRTEWIRHLAFAYAELEKQGLLLPVTDVQIHYGQPARYDDLVEIEVKLSACTPIRLAFTYTIRRSQDGVELVTGSSQHVWVNQAWKPARLDKAMPALYATLCDLIST